MGFWGANPGWFPGGTPGRPPGAPIATNHPEEWVLPTAWLVVFGFPGKPVSWNHPGFRPGKTVYPREPPGISSSGAKDRGGSRPCLC